MYAVISNTTYTQISDLQFDAEADVSGDTIPADEIYASIKTDDDISAGKYFRLYDDLDQLWAKFWIVSADREDTQHVRIHALSDIAVLDYTEMPAIYYSAEPIANVLNAIFAGTNAGSNAYALASVFASETITGFCPKQTARKRLQWVCFVIKAYIQQTFSSKIQIKKISATVEKNILSGKIRYKPSVEFNDYVSKITVRAYDFTLTPKASIAATDEWVKKDDDTYYVMTHQDHSLSNPDFPSNLPPNEVVIDEVYLVNANNVSGILSHFADIYFNRMNVTLEAINNREFFPGEKVTAYTESEAIVAGYITRCSFSFGLQALSSICLIAAEAASGARLTVTYDYDGETIYQNIYYLPVGYQYNIAIRYIDVSDAYHRYIYRPNTNAITGTITAPQAIALVSCSMAIHYNKSTGILRLWDVEDVDWVSGSNEVVKIG